MSPQGYHKPSCYFGTETTSAQTDGAFIPFQRKGCYKMLKWPMKFRDKNFSYKVILCVVKHLHIRVHTYIFENISFKNYKTFSFRRVCHMPLSLRLWRNLKTYVYTYCVSTLKTIEYPNIFFNHRITKRLYSPLKWMQIVWVLARIKVKTRIIWCKNDKKMVKNERNSGKSLRVPNASYRSKYFRDTNVTLLSFMHLKRKTCSSKNTYLTSKVGFLLNSMRHIMALSQPVLCCQKKL